MINWNNIIEEIKNKKGTCITVDPTIWNLDNPHYLDIFEKWKQANFNLSAIKWINFYPEKDFAFTFKNDILELLNLKGIHRCWISQIQPGYYAPWHWDVDDNEELYKKEGIIRYSIFMQNAKLGQIFMLSDDIYHTYNQGQILKWKDYKEWHCGMNGSMESKFLFHVLGH